MRVIGLREAREALAHMAGDAPKELSRSSKFIGNIVVAEIRRRAPQGPHEGGGKVVPIVRSVKADSSTRAVVIQVGGPQTPHAVPEEFGGTIPRRGFKGRGRYAKRFAKTYGAKSVTRIARRPYFYPGVEAKQEQVFKEYEAVIDRLVAKYWVGGPSVGR